MIKGTNQDLPLQGIPISIKDVFDVKGLDTTAGCACHCFDPKADDW